MGSQDGLSPPLMRIISATPVPETRPRTNEDATGDSLDPELSRARSRSRSPQVRRTSTRQANSSTTSRSHGQDDDTSQPVRRNTYGTRLHTTDSQNLLKPSSALGMGREYWRQLSRSPSPLGLIPIHREWRQFIHKHEIPRKLLHISIGFIVLFLYSRGKHIADAAPILAAFLVPIGLTDFARHRYPPLNRFYIRTLGALMRESEAHDKYNGVIFYMLGALFVTSLCAADVAIVSIVCLSWCDTAASTIGRLYGRYTPRIRKGKSLAGSLAACIVGIAATLLFWGVIAPRARRHATHDLEHFAFNGHLTLPAPVASILGWDGHDATITGTAALIIVSIWTGLIVSLSEAIDLWALDDNLTIPVLCGTLLSVSFWIVT